MEQQQCGNISKQSIYKRFSTWISLLWNNVNQRKSATPTLFSKFGAAKCMEIRAARKR
jgi:hypothetical protein